MWRPTSEAHSRRHPENVKGDEMSEMYAVSGPAFEAELAYRRELAHRFVRAGGFGSGRRRTPRRRGLRLPVARPRPAAVA